VQCSSLLNTDVAGSDHVMGQCRYTSANVVINGTWWVGSYGLNPDGEIGPFVGFRSSTDGGSHWTEPTAPAGSPLTVSHSLFGEKVGDVSGCFCFFVCAVYPFQNPCIQTAQAYAGASAASSVQSFPGAVSLGHYATVGTPGNFDNRERIVQLHAGRVLGRRCRRYAH
jgi:hypothetical protein